MDDWNDFGTAAPSHNLPSPADQFDESTHSQSSLRTYSDSFADAASNSNISNIDEPQHHQQPPSSEDQSHPPINALRDSTPLLGPDYDPIIEGDNIERAANDQPQQSTEGEHLNTTDDDIRIQGDDQVNDAIGPGCGNSSDSEVAEPRSVFLGPTRRGLLNPLDEDGFDPDDPDVRGIDDKTFSAVRVYTPRRGDLDDVPDDFELNIEGFRFTAVNKSPNSTSDGGEGEPTSSPIASSLLRHLDKSYTKLEVISAKQIRSLITFFNVLLTLSILYTFFMVITSNTSYKKTIVQLLPAALLTEEQRQNGLGPIFVNKSESAIDVPIRMLNMYSVDVERFAFIDHNADSCFSCWNGNGMSYNSYYEMASNLGFCSSDGYHPSICDSHGNTHQKFIGIKPRQINSSQPPGPFTTETHHVLFGVPTALTVLPPKMKLVHHLFSMTLSIFFLVVSILYLVRLMRAKRRNITHEQIWVFILLVVTFLYFDVIETTMDSVSAIQAISNVISDGEKGGITFPAWLNQIENIVESVRISAFTTFTYFYLWANLHSYRVLDPGQKLGFYSFYLPKLAMLVPFLIFHLSIFHVLGLEFSEIPFLSGPAFAFAYAPYRLWGYLGWEMGLAIAKTVWDGILIAIIFYEAWKTMGVLEHAPYMKYRAKRVGFRFFLYINFMFYACFFILYWITLFGRPVGDVVSRVIPPLNAPRSGLDWVSTTGVWFLLSGYVLCTAYVHLPYTSVGWFKGWFQSSTLGSSGSQWSRSWSDIKGIGSVEDNVTTLKSLNMDSSSIPAIEEEDVSHRHSNNGSKNKPSMATATNSTGTLPTTSKKLINDNWSHDEDEAPISISLVDNDAELQQQIVEPITYRKRESKDSLELKANCFTMQTHVIMFNFAWYVYYYGTPKLDKFRPGENPLPFEFTVDRHLKSVATDTQALVLDCTDRIIVTFKGTTSMKNLRTSLKVSHELLRNVVRLNADGGDESERLKKLFGNRYLQAKIHQGFAKAYLSVMDEVVDRVRTLRGKKVRPVFLTGHSLGGALATICSLDLWVKLNISRREIFVSTFGSPRVGNSLFADVYREVVPLHWRIVVDPDMIARLPKVGYMHVGKKVVLTPHGEMIIDPSALEQRPWSGEAAGFAYHRKASYLLAMRAWCVRNHGMTYTPVFWPFPVRPEDERRFAGAFEHEEDMDTDGSLYGGRSGRRVAQKIIKLDAMVDALGDGGDEIDNMAVLEKWARLTRRVLLNQRLGGATC